jgi:hypothetical protein
VGGPSLDKVMVRFKRQDPAMQITDMGAVIRTNHSMLEYKINEIDEGFLYEGTPLQNCFVQEILIRNDKTLNAVLPSQFGFFPKAQVGDAIDSR